MTASIGHHTRMAATLQARMLIWALVAIGLLCTVRVRGAKEPYEGTIDYFNCNNLCPFARDGVCDDGGPNSKNAYCPYASDCQDCGMRAPYTRAPTSVKVTSYPTARWTPAPEPAPEQRPTTSAPSNTPTPQRLRTSAPVRSGSYGDVTTAQPTPSNTRKPTSKPTVRTKSPSRKPSAKAHKARQRKRKVKKVKKG